MYADTETPINVVLIKEPFHADQHEVQVVHRRALNNPINSTCHKLAKKNR